ncbi:hypothetical protein [Caulobacter soli]|uniref:hypothetical protein n=1 Tax=Caulobacter soli TaxID=2708539 RepID=UPI0013EB0DDA|nr:hypothetical protein [Caulobacter soli]
MSYRRAWDGHEWQRYALQLVQLRHGHQHVQPVPDHVGGDAGLEFICLDKDGGKGGVLYQCYAPEETADVGKAAIAQKSKARRDLNKLQANKDKLGEILTGLKIDRWILLCPFLDNKDVVAAARDRGIEIRDLKLPFLADNFEALVHCQDDFVTEIEMLRQQGAMPMKMPAQDPALDIAVEQDGDIGKRITEKLNRGFKATMKPDQIRKRRDAFIRAHLYRENALAELKLNHPALWDRSIQVLDAEEQRLAAVGAASDLPGQQLQESLNRLEAALQKDLPDISGSFATTVAMGTIGDWLIRCPLDFPDDDQ